jgi:ketosteroid isomerase-like protein
MMSNKLTLAPMIAGLSAAIFSTAANADEKSDRTAVAILDTAYQAAVKANDATAMDRILAPGFVLILGNGTVVNREDLLADARQHSVTYERQEEDAGTQTVRVWFNTAVVTARLWLKGTQASGTFDRRLWFSDTYVRTPQGWRYVFGQASMELPEDAPAHKLEPGS